jgi:ribosomal protein S18 acetylase RimI-like enzyme
MAVDERGEIVAVIAAHDGTRILTASNTRAQALYECLGFVALPRRRPRSRRLPAELESVRMRWMPSR